jgi:hypothetical protein
MSRIRAGNTLANQYAPPFSISSAIASGWMLRWDDRLKAFTAYNPADEVLPPGGFESIIAQEFVVTSSITYLDVAWQVPDKASLIVTINGVKQHQDSYVINTENHGEGAMRVTFIIAELDEPILSGDRIELVGLQASTPGNVRVKSFTVAQYNPVDQIYTLPWVAPSKESLIVTINGIKQSVSSYTLNPKGTSTELEFINEPPDTIPPEPDVGQGQDEIWLEIVGILGSQSGDGWRVAAANVDNGSDVGGTRFGVFESQVISGDLQLLNFRSLRNGNHVRIEQLSDASLRIDTRGFANIGNGQPILVTPIVGNDPFEFREIAGTPGETTSGTVNGDTIVIGLDKGYVTTAGASYNIPATARLVGVQAITTTVNLPAANAAPNGTRITIKDEAGTAGVVSIAVTGTIDGDVGGTSISVNYGSLTVYTNGTSWFTIG